MIKEFKKEYVWLSNFAPVKILFDGIEYPSVEHAYMSAKSDTVEWKLFCSNRNNSAAIVKSKSKSIKLKDNWEDIKVLVITVCLTSKFTNEFYKNKLINTGNIHLQEGNMWNDKFWGVCLKTGEGYNMLGKIIMSIRSELQKQIN